MSEQASLQNSTACLVNGQHSATVPVDDRGLHYGDGLFETVAVVDGRPRRWQRHLRRLQWGCARLGIPYPGDEVLQQEAVMLCAASTAEAERSVLKIMLSRGGGAQAYRPLGDASATRILCRRPWPLRDPALSETGIRMRVCSTRLAQQPQLAGLKHLNRLEQVLARREWLTGYIDEDIQEGLMLDADEQVIEGTMTNLFIVRDGQLLTPKLTSSGVAGVMRAQVMEYSAEQGIHCQETSLSLADVRAADEVFVTNSLIELWPVRELEEQDYVIGDLTRRIQAVLAVAPEWPGSWS